jgi:hypothetical protein
MTNNIYKIIFLLLSTVFFACNSKPEKSEEKTDSLEFKTEVNDNKSNIAYENLNKSEYVRGKDPNLILKEFLSKDVIKSNKFYGAEGGDCGGFFEKLENKVSNSYLINNRWDCSDYGFNKNSFLVENGTPYIVKRFSIGQADDNGFVVKEVISLIKSDSIEVWQRQKYVSNVIDTILNDIKYHKTKIFDKELKHKIKSEILELEGRRIE